MCLRLRPACCQCEIRNLCLFLYVCCSWNPGYMLQSNRCLLTHVNIIWIILEWYFDGKLWKAQSWWYTFIHFSKLRVPLTLVLKYTMKISKSLHTAIWNLNFKRIFIAWFQNKVVTAGLIASTWKWSEITYSAPSTTTPVFYY